MRTGLRLQLLLLLAAILVLAFVPLYFATSTYTRVALRKLQTDHAESMGRAVAAHVAEAQTRRSDEELLTLLDAQLENSEVEAIAIYASPGSPTVRAGAPALVETLGRLELPEEKAVLRLAGGHGPTLAIVVPTDRGTVVTVLRVDDEATRATPLVGLVGLYMVVVGLGTLVAAYFALTRLIVRPVDGLSSAAERVALGARELEVPRRAPRELAELGESLRTMTQRLLDEENALRRKIDEVERATEQLKAAQDTVVRSERLASVGRLAAGLAHEIGNPISALIGLQDLLLEGGLSEEEQHEFLVRMQKETGRVHRILADLLQFARPAADRPQPVTPGKIEPAVADTLALLRPQRAMHDVTVHDRVAPDLPSVPLAHEALVQLLLNLIMNAADACERHGTITVDANASKDGKVVLSVTDDGPGVSAEIRSELFEPFVTTKEVGKGTGLGLAVSRGLVEGAGGTISLDESHSPGARFVIELPPATEAAAPETGSTAT